MALPLEKLNRALKSLQQTLAGHGGGGTLSRKLSDPNGKIKQEIHRVKTTFVSTDLSHSESRLVISRILHILIGFLHHTDEGLRNQSYEAFLTLCRHLILIGHDTRLLLILISELNDQPQAKSAAAILTTLSRTIHLAKLKRLLIFATYTLTAVEELLIRPEEAVHLALIANLTVLFKAIGPHLDKLNIVKKDPSLPYEKRSQALKLLNSVFSKCLDVRGTPNRSAVLAINQLCTYSPYCLNKTATMCTEVLSRLDDQTSPIRLTATMNIMKGLWPLILNDEELTKKTPFKKLISLLLCLTHSSVNEVLIASFECLTTLIPLLPREYLLFYPPDVVLSSPGDSTITSPNRELPQSVNSSPFMTRRSLAQTDSMLSRHSSANSLMVDLPSKMNDYDSISITTDSIAPSMNGDDNESGISPSGSWTSDENKDDQDEIIDPLMHSDLYEEEVSKRIEEEPSPIPQSTPQSSTVLDSLPDIFQGDPRRDSINLPEYTIVLITYRFLLQPKGASGLMPDTKVRVSHKMLSLGLITVFAARTSAVLTLQSPAMGSYQGLHNLTALIYHTDDKLAAAAVNFIATAQSSAGDLPQPQECKEWLGFVWTRMSTKNVANARRSLLQAFTGKQEMLEKLDLVGKSIQLAANSGPVTYGLLKVSMAQFLCSIKWSRLKASIRTTHQNAALDCLLDLLADKDPGVVNIVAEQLPLFVKNADYGTRFNEFSLDLPVDILHAFQFTPMVLGLPDSFSFRDIPIDYELEKTLMMVLVRIIEKYSSYRDVSLSNPSTFDYTVGFIFALSSLSSSFPPHLYHEPWSSTLFTTHGLLSLLADIADSSIASTSLLSKLLRLQSSILGGFFSRQLMDIVCDKASTSNRESLPNLPDIALLDKLLVMPLRVLNLYYCIVEDRRMELSGRQNLSLGSKHKDLRGTEKIAAYTRLPNTGIILTKNTSFIECPSLTTIAPQLRGAHKNYLDSVDQDCENKLLELLHSSIELLSTLLEVLRVPIVRPLIPEICTYIEVLTPFSPLGMTRLSTQLLKSLFGRNAASLNLGHLKSMRINKGDQIKSLDEVPSFLISSELQVYKNRITVKEILDSQYMEHIGWLSNTCTVLPPAQAPSEVTTSLKYFESFITRMIALYGNSTDVETKKAILTLFTQLRISGIELDLADPRKIVTAAVEEQLGHISFPEMLKEVLEFLIILARNGGIRWPAVRQHTHALCNALKTEKCYDDILNGIEIALKEFIIVRKEIPTEVVQTLFSADIASILLVHTPAKYLQLFHMWLHAVTGDEESWTNASHILMRQLTLIYSNDRLPTRWITSKEGKEILHSVILALSAISPSSLLPIVNFVTLLKSRIYHPSMEENNEKEYCDETIIAMVPIIVIVFSDLFDEQRFLHRTEPHFTNNGATPLDWLFRPLARSLRLLSETMETDRPEDRNDENVLVVHAASRILRTIATADRPFMLNEFLTCAYDEGLISNEYQHKSCRLSAEWLIIFVKAEENDRIATQFMDSLLHNYLRLNHRYLEFLSLQLLIRFLAKHQSQLSNEVKNLKKKFLIYTTKDRSRSVQLDILRAAQQSKELHEQFVRSIPEDIARSFVALAFNSIGRSANKTESMTLLDAFINNCQKVHGRGKFVVKSPIQRRHHQFAGTPSQLISADCALELFLCSLHQPRFPPRLVPGIFAMNHRELTVLLKHIIDGGRLSQFIQTVLCTASRLVTRAAADPEGLVRIRSNISLFLKMLIDNPRLGDDGLFTVFANITPLIVQKVETDVLDEYVEQYEKIIDIALERLNSKRRVEETCSALYYFLQHPSTVQTFRVKPIKYLLLIHRLLLSLVRVVERKSGEEYTVRDDAHSFSVRGIDIQSEEHDQLSDCFNACQYVMTIYRKNTIPSEDPLALAVRTLLRLPLLNSFALTPKTALDGGWHPPMELCNDGISLPLPPIHKLSDIDVLDDFTWRTLYLGWTTRQQFESIWVSLVGVLSSTPSGDELKSELACEAVQVSSLAVRRLCSFLLLTQMEPQPGNPIGGKYRLPTRDVPTTFSGHPNYNRLCDLLGTMTDDPEPETMLKRSIEWTIGSKRNRKEFHLDQSSIYDLWAHVGVANDGKSAYLSPLRSTSTYFLDQLRIELDAASAVRSLYENFSHWFSRGIDVMPMELLSETLRAICLLSDLFEDVTSFSSLDVDMRMLAYSGYVNHGDEYGLVILSLCKAVAVTGQDYERGNEEQLKRLQSMIVNGLEHRRNVVRCCTMRGVLFILQSLTADTLIDLVKFLVDWTITQLETFSMVADPIVNNGDHTSIEYTSLVWSMTFRLIEHPSRIMTKGKLFQMVINVFLSSSPAPSWQMEALTIGLQELMLHSQTFAAPCAKTAIACIEKFSSFPYRLPYALRILCVAVHREPRLIDQFQTILPFLMETSRMCDTNELKQIVMASVSIKLLRENPIEVQRWLTTLIFLPNGRIHPQPFPILDAIHNITRSIIKTQVEAGLLDLSRDLIKNGHKVGQRDFILSLTLAALSPFTQFVHLYDSLLGFDPSDTPAWTLFLQHYRELISA